MNTDLHFSSATDEWPTPQWLFDALNKEFGFTLDPASTPENAKCKRFFTAADVPLAKDWGTETIFLNPPYSACADWMRKAYGAALEGATVVCLVPARTDTKWWHEYAMKGEIRFIRGRLKFGNHENSAPFPSAIIVFRPREFRLLSMTANYNSTP
ncbi:MAG TPA: phage N-6-adenine-methyltransferase [Gammaproteobacteria bacterium]|nr:phage N-6-adenine-methyltransferase [Gammaproteobacteria bacterium]